MARHFQGMGHEKEPATRFPGHDVHGKQPPKHSHAARPHGITRHAPIGRKRTTKRGRKM